MSSTGESASVGSTRSVIPRSMIEHTSSMFGGIGIGIAGIWLVFLYIIFVSLVVFTLSAHQLQYAIKAVQIEGESLPFSVVTNIYENWEKANDVVSSIEYRISEKRYNVEEIERRISELQESLTEISFEESYDRNLETKKEISFKKSQVADLENEISELEIKLNRYKERAKEIYKFQGQELDIGIGDFIETISYFKGLEGTIRVFGFDTRVSVPSFSSMPADMLTLILVLAMGALGGTIHLTRFYFAHKVRGDFIDGGIVRGAGYYLFRPFLGAVTALSVYILAKAGVLVISTPSTSGSGAPLSPFFVSFIGIISGMLAEQALDTIQRAGGNWFSSNVSADRERWAYKLKEKLAEDEDQKRELSRFLDIRLEDLNAWLDERQPVPAQAQTIIAAWFQMPVRDLFTDLGPDRPPGAVGEAPGD